MLNKTPKMENGPCGFTRLGEKKIQNHMFPCEQPHPTTNEYDQKWADRIQAVGPVGLLVEIATWHGVAVDKDLRLWQQGEEPVDILRVPYQNLKRMALGMAARARSRAEWVRDSSRRLNVREIDREASQLSKKLTDEEKGMVRTAQIGGTLAKDVIAGFNEDVKEQQSTSDGDAASSNR